MIHVVGIEHLQALKGTPVIALAPHFIGLNVGGIRVAYECPGTASIYSRQKNPVLDDIFLKARSRFGNPVLVSRQDGLRAVVRTIRAGHPFYFFPDMDFGFNQFLVDAEEPLLFHTGQRALFPVVTELIGRVMPVERLRWITFGHVEADECGSMNMFLEAAPQATVAHTAIGCMVQVNDLADRAPRPLGPGEVIDVGGKRIRNIDTPHVPHGWDAHVLYEEVTGTLLCGDLFTSTGKWEPLVSTELLAPAFAAEDVFKATALTPATAPTINALADLRPQTLALMHGPSYNGDCEKQLRGLAEGYDRLLADARA